MLHDACFADDAIAQHTHGAGIIPIAKAPDGRTHVLLGKEHHVVNWKGSGKWSGFEGGRKDGESVEQAAIREWNEESLNICDDVIAEDLIDARFVAKLVLAVTPSTRPLRQTVLRFHVTYLVEVPFDAHLSETFDRRRCQVLDLYGSALRFRKALVDVTHITSAVSEIHIHDHIETTFIFVDGASLCYAHPLADDVRQCLLAHAFMIETFLASDLRNCVPVRRAPGGDIVDICITEDYLEKESVRWWSIDHLKHVLYSGGRSDDDSFRAYFLPVIEAIIAIESRVV